MHRALRPEGRSHTSPQDVLPPFLNIHSASLTGNLGLVAYALSSGIHPSCTLDGLTPLHAACAGMSDNGAVVALLLERGADVNAQRGGLRRGDGKRLGGVGYTPLHFTASTGHTSLIPLLLRAGADPTIADKQGNLPHHVASQFGHAEVEALLLGALNGQSSSTNSTSNSHSTGNMNQNQNHQPIHHPNFITTSTSKRLLMKKSLENVFLHHHHHHHHHHNHNHNNPHRRTTSPTSPLSTQSYSQISELARTQPPSPTTLTTLYNMRRPSLPYVPPLPPPNTKDEELDKIREAFLGIKPLPTPLPTPSSPLSPPAHIPTSTSPSTSSQTPTQSPTQSETHPTHAHAHAHRSSPKPPTHKIKRPSSAGSDSGSGSGVGVGPGNGTATATATGIGSGGKKPTTKYSLLGVLRRGSEEGPSSMSISASISASASPLGEKEESQSQEKLYIPPSSISLSSSTSNITPTTTTTPTFPTQTCPTMTPTTPTTTHTHTHTHRPGILRTCRSEIHGRSFSSSSSSSGALSSSMSGDATRPDPGPASGDSNGLNEPEHEHEHEHTPDTTSPSREVNHKTSVKTLRFAGVGVWDGDRGPDHDVGVEADVGVSQVDTDTKSGEGIDMDMDMDMDGSGEGVERQKSTNGSTNGSLINTPTPSSPTTTTTYPHPHPYPHPHTSPNPHAHTIQTRARAGTAISASSSSSFSTATGSAASPNSITSKTGTRTRTELQSPSPHPHPHPHPQLLTPTLTLSPSPIVIDDVPCDGVGEGGREGEVPCVEPDLDVPEYSSDFSDDEREKSGDGCESGDERENDEEEGYQYASYAPHRQHEHEHEHVYSSELENEDSDEEESRSKSRLRHQPIQWSSPNFVSSISASGSISISASASASASMSPSLTPNNSPSYQIRTHRDARNLVQQVQREILESVHSRSGSGSFSVSVSASGAGAGERDGDGDKGGMGLGLGLGLDMDLSEQLAAYGETLAIERRFARGERQRYRTGEEGEVDVDALGYGYGSVPVSASAATATSPGFGSPYRETDTFIRGDDGAVTQRVEERARDRQRERERAMREKTLRRERRVGVDDSRALVSGSVSAGVASGSTNARVQRSLSGNASVGNGVRASGKSNGRRPHTSSGVVGREVGSSPTPEISTMTLPLRPNARSASLSIQPPSVHAVGIEIVKTTPTPDDSPTTHSAESIRTVPPFHHVHQSPPTSPRHMRYPNSHSPPPFSSTYPRSSSSRHRVIDDFGPESRIATAPLPTVDSMPRSRLPVSRFSGHGGYSSKISPPLSGRGKSTTTTSPAYMSFHPSRSSTSSTGSASPSLDLLPSRPSPDPTFTRARNMSSTPKLARMGFTTESFPHPATTLSSSDLGSYSNSNSNSSRVRSGDKKRFGGLKNFVQSIKGKS